MGRFKDETEGRAIASKDSYFGVNSVSAIMQITDKIVKATCIGWFILYNYSLVSDIEAEQFIYNTKFIIQIGPKTCTECDFPKCPTTCGYDGQVKGFKDCSWRDKLELTGDV